ncbi:MAG: hypothetical protein KKA73_07200, partial [Chloroflexi bacterium]|nr:hypothetical protein [Chloroflexota bacterium]
MILKSFEELGVALPCPASPDASALVREADDLLEALGAMVHAARESRQRAAGQAETAATLADKAQAIEAQLAQAQGLTGFGVDGDVLETLEAQATAMRRLAQELQEDPAVQAYLAQQAAAAATQEQVTAATRRRLTQALGQARDWLRQGEHEKAAALIGEIRAAASKEDLAAEFEEATAELESIVAQAQETVKIRAAAAREREAAAQEREDRRAFARWLDRVREQADWSRGDVVVTLGLGQGLHLRPQPARRGHTLWHPLSHVGVEEPQGPISSLPRRAKVWDWRGQVPGAARTLAEAAQRAGPVSR